MRMLKIKKKTAHLDESGQPEWMDLVRPVVTFDDIKKEISFDDGGPDYDWSQTSNMYPKDLGTSWIENLNKESECDSQKLDLADADLSLMNENQKSAFNIVMQTLLNFINGDSADNPFELLRMVVSGTAGSEKSFLIKCLVKAVRSLFGSNKSVQVVCPSGNNANIISDDT